MSLKCGIVGLPNVGKSTLFNALTNANVIAKNYPFSTIKPNIGTVEVPDQRLKEISKLIQAERVVPALVEFIDIAGLISGASQGEGLGNQFLAYIRETDAIAHVIRCFSNSNVVHISNEINLMNDINIVYTELMLADLLTTEKALAHEKKIFSSKKSTELIVLLERIVLALNQLKPIRLLNLTVQERLLIKPLCLITLKPEMYVANISENIALDKFFLDQLIMYAKKQNIPVVIINASIEAEIALLNDVDKNFFLNEMKMQESGTACLIRAAFSLLGLHAFFTAGVKEVRAWTIPRGATALQASGVIHTEFQRGFIRAQTISYDDYVCYRGSVGAKKAGKMRLEGKEYVIQDGDIINFLFNV